MNLEAFNNLLEQARQIARGLVRSPGFTAIAVLTMALSIGANTAMFSVIETVLLRPLPYREPSRIVMLWSTVPSKDILRNWTSYPDIQDWRHESSSFAKIAAVLRVDTATLTGGGPAERIKAGRVSSEFFSVLGVSPELGRSWTADEEERRAPVAVVSHAFWQTHFGGAPNVIGRPLDIDHKQALVIGVMPAGFDFPTEETSVWVPLSFIANWPAFLTARQADAFNAVARLKPGVTPQQAQEEMSSISARLNSRYPQFEAGKSVSVVPLPLELVGPRIRTGLWMLYGAVLFLLLIACANVASLVLARQSSKERDSAVRLALGASRARLIRLQLLECLIMSLFAALPGLALAAACIPVLRILGPTEIRGIAGLRLDPAILVFCLLLSLLTGFVFGLGPAWISTHRDPHAVLKAGGRTITGRVARRRLGSLFMTLQFALAMVLVTGAGLMLRSFLQVENVNLGYRPQRLLFLHLDVPASQEIEPSDFYDEALARIRVIPGAKGAGAIDALFSDYVPDDVVQVEGPTEFTAGDEAAATGSHVVSKEFFGTAGVPLLHGRFFASTDGPHSQPVAIVNESMAKRFWPGKDPIGNRFRYGVPGETPSTWRTVVGIVGDILPGGPESRAFPQFFLPQDQAQGTGSMDIVVRTAGDPLSLANSIRAAVLSIRPDIPRFEISTVESELERLGNRRRFQTWLLSTFSAVALILAGIGIYGLVSYSVAERTSEIGIRMAIGAQRGDVLQLVMGEGARLAGLGIIVGIVVSLAITRLVSSLLFGISATDPLTFLGVAMLLSLVALTASYFPARRAMRVDPVTAMRDE